MMTWLSPVWTATEAKNPRWFRRQRIPAADLHGHDAGSTNAVSGSDPETQSSGIKMIAWFWILFTMLAKMTWML